ncbi:MAG: hypothetical protein ACLFRY_06560 [Spirochaetia bacterium]
MNKENRDTKESYSPGDSHFHYNREERFRYLSPEITNRKKKKGIFKGNRGLIILLIDVLLILLLYFILNPLLQGRASSSDFMGYEVRLRAFFYEDEVFISLRFTVEDPAEAAGRAEGGPAGTLARVLFSLEESETVVEETDILPVGEGDERVVRTRMIPTGKPGSARAEVSIGEQTIVLETDIRPEQE